MENKNFIKNITSKDRDIYRKALDNLINAQDNKNFEVLCQNSSYIFPHIKDRIIEDFIKLVNRENLKIIFEYSKIYCDDFEDLIVKSWLKFACEDLTDEVLEIFDNGTNEQKTYCAMYFKYINDPLALDNLKKYSKNDFSPLRINCAQALSVFKDNEILDKMECLVKNSDDDFEKLRAFEFIIAYKSSDSIEFVLDNCFDCSFCLDVILNLLDYNSLFEIKEKCNGDMLIRIFNLLIEAYPETLSLDTVKYYSIFDFIKLIEKINSQYALNSLILAKIKFSEFYENDIYSYDLDKNLKFELEKIYNALNRKFNIENLDKELRSKNQDRIIAALDVIGEMNFVEYSPVISELVNSNLLTDMLIAKAVMTLKKLKNTFLVNREIIDNIENENIKALVKNCIQN